MGIIKKVKEQPAIDEQSTALLVEDSKNNRIWYDGDGKRCSEEGDAQIFGWVEDQHRKSQLNHENPVQLIIGTDSQSYGQIFRFISVVCVYRPGKGGNFFYTVVKQPRNLYKGNQQARMFHEATLSIELANTLVEAIRLKPIIHIDMSPKKGKAFTSTFSDAVVGYVKGFGYDSRIKPDSWISSCVADRFSKR